PPAPTAPSPLSLHDALPICPGVGPPSRKDVERHLPSLDVRVVHVGDLELAPGRRREAADDVEHAPVVHVAARHHQVALGRLRLLDRKSTRLNSSHVAISYAV